jgi:hypothetical protein
MQVRNCTILVECALGIGLTLAFILAAQAPKPSASCVVELSENQARLWEHRLGATTAIHLDAVEAHKLSFEDYLTFQIVVSPDGHVESATPIGDEKRHVEEGRAIEMARRFKPWAQDGRDIRVRVTDYVELLPPEEWALFPQKFPEQWDLKGVEIKLSRTACFGTCPDYSVSIRGDGGVHFTGRRFVLIPGNHEVRILPEAVMELVEKFERARFFAARDKYVAGVTDNPTYTLSLTLAGKTKSVTDYVGTQVGMPLAIVDLERDVDELAGTERWIKGNTESAPSLKAENWPLGSNSTENSNLYASVVREKNQPLIELFLAARAPIDSLDDSAQSPVCVASDIGNLSLVRRMMEEHDAVGGGKLPRPVLNRCLANAAGSGDVKVVQFWLARGADPNAAPERRGTWASGESVLARALRSLSPEVVREILKYKPDLKKPIDGTEPVLSYVLEDGEMDKGETERVEIIEMLIKAGADVNARGRIGQTPIFYAIFTPGAVKPLLKAGADINARDLFGDTTFTRNAYHEPFVKELLADGADPAVVDNQGETALKRAENCKECATLIKAALSKPQRPQ